MSERTSVSEDQRLGREPACAAIEIRTFGFHNGMPDPVQKVYHTGLTKRELFAAMAMQAILTGAVTKGCPAMEWFEQDMAVRCADALLKELAK